MESFAIFITFLGQSCFLLETPQGKILMDPYNPQLGYPVKPIAADIVTVSHEHFDHNYVEMSSGAPAVLRGLKGQGKTADWNEVRFDKDGLKIRSFPAYHDASKGSERGKDAMFLIETDGLRILHTGDLGRVLDEKLVKEIGRVDILLICVGGHYTIGPEEAKKVVDELHPRVVIPMHWKTKRTGQLPIQDETAFLAMFKNVRRADDARFGFTADLSAFPKDQTTILRLPYRE